MRLKRWIARARGVRQAWDPGVKLEPRAPRPGETIGPPDFVGVGAQKAGTTWWFDQLLTHPAVRGPANDGKELHYFNRCVLEQPDGDLQGYHRWFPRRPGQLVGEWTPAYMSQFWTAPLLREVAPEARILAVLRDPWERYVSGLTHHAARGRVLTPELVNDAAARSCYSEQVERLYASFPAEQVLILQYELCRSEPQVQFDRTLAFLGLEPHVLPAPGTRSNATTSSKVPIEPRVEALLRPRFAEDAQRLQALVPELDLSLWPSS